MKKIAVITGASGGLGKEFVRQVINEVDEVWAIGRNVAKLEELRTEFGETNSNGGEGRRGAAGSKIIPLQMDLSDTKSYDLLSGRLESEGGASAVEISWLINNAGAGRFAPSTDFSTEELAAGITTHCTAIASICNICIPYMKAGDHLVNVASQSAFCPLPYMNLYAATKAFVYSYSRALREELRETGIVVTTICPGWIKTTLLPETLNGHKVKFPFLVTADKVAAKAIRDACRGKALSIYRFAVRYVSWLLRHCSTAFTIRVWAKSVKKYL